MIGLLTLSTAILFPPDQATADLHISPAAFREWFNSAARGQLTISAEIVQSASRFRYVFIGGLQIGMMQGYLQQNARELRDRGVPRGSIHVIIPSSQSTVAENAELVRSEILKIAGKGQEKLVVIAHSRGACDALAFALENPRFVAMHICALFLVQGPFGGTGVADYVAGEGPAIDRQMPLGHRLVGKAIGRLEAGLLDDDRHEVIASLSHRASERFWDELLETHSAALPVVAPKTFYVTSRVKASRHPLLQRTTASYLGTYYGPNDGLVALEDQSLPGLGTVLAVLDVGHTDLTRRFPAARPKAKLRRALVDAILMAVGTPQEHRVTRSETRSDLPQGRSR
jgi:pimeloyl-ACP methyl ester carboxylesterase